MNFYRDEEWRMSLCMLQYKRNGEPNNFRRIADYVEQSNGEYRIVWISEKLQQHEAKDSEFLAENPSTLYKPSLVESVSKSNSDFINLRWYPNYIDGKSRYYVQKLSWEAEQRLKKIKPIEVIDYSDEVKDRAEFREKLRSGISLANTPASRILMVFASNDIDRLADAIYLRDRDLRYNNGLYSLQPFLAGNSPSMDIYRLSYDDICAFDLQAIDGFRNFYMPPTLPEPVGKMPIRAFEDYADDYVKWFYNQAAEGLTRTQKQSISSLIERAFNAPTKLEEYIGATLPKEELAEIIDSLSRAVNLEDDSMIKLISAILESDEKFKESCRQELLSRNTPEMISLRAEVDKLSKERDDAELTLSMLCQKQEQIQLAIDENQRKKEFVETELHDLENQKDQLLQRLENDITLRLSLHAVASNKSQNNETAHSLIPVVNAYTGLDELSIAKKDTVFEALSLNIKQLGYKKADDQSFDFKAFAQGILFSLSATNILAIDSTFAAAVANSLSFALNGQAAKHVSIPESYSDIDAILRQCEADDHNVIVLDNVVDILNEGIIFAISRLNTDAIFILPVGARGNIRLLAPEIWERVFYIPTENSVCIPVHNLSNLKLYKGSVNWELIKPSANLYDDTTVVENISDTVPVASWYLPLAIADVIETAAEEDESLDSFSVDKWLFLHLLLVAYSNGSQDAIDKLQNSSESLLWNVEGFMRRMEGTRNGR